MNKPVLPEPQMPKIADCYKALVAIYGQAWYEYGREQMREELQAMERKPMTQEKAEELAHRRATTYTHRSAPGYSSYAFVPHTLMDFVRDLEAHHGIKGE